MLGIILASLSVLLFILLSIYILRKQRDVATLLFTLVLILLASIEALDQIALHSQTGSIELRKAALFLESFLPITLLFMSITHLRHGTLKMIPAKWWILGAVSVYFPVSLFVFPLSDFIYAPDLQSEKIIFLGNAGYWFYIGLMLYCIAALMNLEATFASVSGINRWKIKFEFIGLTGIIAALIFYYSQGLLYRTINMNLIPARSGIFAISTIFIGYSMIFRGNSIRVALSRNILYKSITLFAVGIYLLFLGLLGEGMRHLDISFGRALTIFLGFLAGLVFLAILLSERVRRKIKVYTNKHFFKHKHEYRDEWLKFTNRLSICKTPDDVYEAILTTYKETFGLQGIALYTPTMHKERYFLAKNHSMYSAKTDLKLSEALSSYFIDKNRVLNPYDGEYLLTSEESDFIREGKINIILPLICNQSIEGLIVFGKQLVEEKFNYEDYDLMKILARQAALAISSFRLSEELIESREIASIAKISSFIIHDLKNMTYTLSLIVDNAEQHIANSEFQKDMLSTIKNTLRKMEKLSQKLKAMPAKNVLNTQPSDINILCEETISQRFKNNTDIKIIHNGSAAMSQVDQIEMQKVIVNLLQNAVEACGKKGVINIETGMNSSCSYIKITDNGSGMTEDYIKNHLFKPFRTTKKKGMGIGLYQSKQIVEAHGGRIEVKSEINKGTVFTIYLPCIKADEAVI